MLAVAQCSEARARRQVHFESVKSGAPALPRPNGLATVFEMIEGADSRLSDQIALWNKWIAALPRRGAVNAKERRLLSWFRTEPLASDLWDYLLRWDRSRRV